MLQRVQRGQRARASVVRDVGTRRLIAHSARACRRAAEVSLDASASVSSRRWSAAIFPPSMSRGP
jgi:hypothetical protein